MSQSKKRYYALATIVDDFLLLNDLPNGYFAKALLFGINGLRTLRLDVNQDVKTTLLSVSERRTAVLPEGFVDWVKVAVKRGQYAVTLSVNDALTGSKREVNETTTRALLSQTMPNGIDFGAYGGYQFLSYSGGPIYSIGQGIPSKGYFKVVDRGEYKELMLDYDINSSQIYLEYITDGIEICGESFVHPYEYDYMIAYMEMLYEKKNNPKASNGSKSDAEVTLEAEGRKLRARFNDLKPQDLLDLERSETRLTPRI